MIEMFSGFDVPDQLEFDSINTNYSLTTGRFGGSAALGPQFQKTLTSVTTRIIGLAFYVNSVYPPMGHLFNLLIIHYQFKYQ